MAALFAIKSFAKNIRNCEILLRIDNTTAVSYVNKMGGVQHPNLHRIAEEIWQWCESRDIWLVASYIKSEENVEADRESRVKNIDTEWELADYAFRRAVGEFGEPRIDLFATRCNTKCERYFFWENDPEVLAIDAFTKDWHSLGLFWAFPPFALILRVLKKIVVDKATGIVVVPLWSSQLWFPLFMKLLLKKPLIFRPSPTLLISPCRSIHHPLARKLSLMVGILSGNLLKEEDCQDRR